MLGGHATFVEELQGRVGIPDRMAPMHFVRQGSRFRGDLEERCPHCFELPDLMSEPGFHAPWFVETLLHQFADSFLCGRPFHRTNRFAAEAQRQHEQPRAPLLTTLRIAHHGPGAVIHL